MVKCTQCLCTDARTLSVLIKANTDLQQTPNVVSLHHPYTPFREKKKNQLIVQRRIYHEQKIKKPKNQTKNTSGILLCLCLDISFNPCACVPAHADIHFNHFGWLRNCKMLTIRWIERNKSINLSMPIKR